MNKLQEIFLKNNIQKHLKYIIPIVMILFWVIYTLMFVNWNMFNTDEIHHWNIAKDLKITEIIELMRYEGHTLLWYLCLKPFTISNFHFPYIIKFINWVFVFVSMIIFWRFSPINNGLKILVTISYPFLNFFPVLGRCYGLSLLFLSSLCALYKNRLKHPIIFAILIILAANTHIVACIPAFYLGLIFLFDLVRNKRIKDLIISLGIFSLCLILFYIQWHNHVSPSYVNDTLRARYELFKVVLTCNRYLLYEDHFIAPYFNWFLNFILIITPFVTCLYLQKNKRMLFFIISSWLTIIILLLFVYQTYEQHIYFMYIYLIMAYWLSLYSENINKKRHIIFQILFAILFILLFQFYRTNTLSWAQDINEYISTKNDIEKFAPKNSVIYTRMPYALVLMQYLRDNYQLKTLEGTSIHSLEAYEKTWEYNLFAFKYAMFDNFYAQGKYITPNSYILLKCDDLLKNKFSKNQHTELGYTKEYCIYKLN